MRVWINLIIVAVISMDFLKFNWQLIVVYTIFFKNTRQNIGTFYRKGENSIFLKLVDVSRCACVCEIRKVFFARNFHENREIHEN